MEEQTKVCHNCGREGYYYSFYLKQNLCKKHLEKMLIRRIRSTLITKSYKQRRFNMVDDGSIGYKMVSFVFRRDKDSTLTLRNGTLDDFAVSVLKYFVKGEKPKQKIGSEKFFNPIYTTSEEELAAFFASKRIRYKKRKRGKADLYLLDFIKDIEKRRPGGMLSIVKIGEKMDIV